MAAANDANDDGELEMLLHVAAGVVVRNADPARFFIWFEKAFPALAPRLAGQAPSDRQGRRSFLHIFGRAIWDRIPRPDNQYRPRPLPKPERNQACPCGSGLKFKHCCQPMAPLAQAIEGVSLLRFVLQQYPAKTFADLPFGHLMPEEVAHVATEWIGAGDVKRAAALLEPMLADLTKLDARHAPGLWTLLDCYDALDKPRKKKQLLEAAMKAPDKQLASDATQRMATMLSDRGDHAGARRLFAEAQRLTPDDPALSQLEVLLLISQGEKERAAERAKFWIARLSRYGDEYAELIAWLRRVSEDTAGAMLEVAAISTPALARLAELFGRLPAIEPRYRLKPDGDSAGPLDPDPALTGLLVQWRQRVEQDKPSLVWMEAEDAIDWSHADGVLSWLERQPLAWSSFEVLDDLVLSLRAAPQALFLGAEEKLMLPLLARAEALLHRVIEINQAVNLKLEWGWLENRPALRLIAGLAYAHDRADRVEEAVRVKEWMLFELNPTDNHGLRDSLSRQYLELGRIDDALRLVKRYPRDMAVLQYNRALALYMAGRSDEALTALKHAKQDCPTVFKMLLHPNPRRPVLYEGSITVGGKDEAWYYREDHLALWHRSGALAWARAVKP